LSIPLVTFKIPSNAAGGFANFQVNRV